MGMGRSRKRSSKTHTQTHSPVKSPDKNDLHDFLFICDEITRYMPPLAPEVKEEIKKRAFYTLPHPSGAGVLLGSYAAKEKFEEIAKRALNKRPEIRERISNPVIIAALEHFFCEHILKSGKSLTSQLAKKVIEDAINHAKNNNLDNFTHFFPCVLPYDPELDHFSVGPIEFTRTDTLTEKMAPQFLDYIDRVSKFHTKKEKELHGEVSDETAEKILLFVQGFPQDLKEHYADYPWIAKIKIESFEKERSREVAHTCIQSALNILTLFFTLSQAKQVCLGERFHHKHRTAYMIERDNSDIEISCSRHFWVKEKTKWIKNLFEDNHFGYRLKLAGSLIPFLSSPSPVPILYQRYINALWWYGEAMTTDIPYLKVTALSNALEAFLSTAEVNKGKITSQISNRGSLILEKINPKRDWKKEIRNFYSLRSDLVHGRIPAFDRKVREQISVGSYIVQNILILGLSWTHYLSHQEDCRTNLNSIHFKFEKDLPQYAIDAINDMRVLPPETE